MNAPFSSAYFMAAIISFKFPVASFPCRVRRHISLISDFVLYAFENVFGSYPHIRLAIAVPWISLLIYEISFVLLIKFQPLISSIYPLPSLSILSPIISFGLHQILSDMETWLISTLVSISATVIGLFLLYFFEEILISTPFKESVSSYNQEYEGVWNSLNVPEFFKYHWVGIFNVFISSVEKNYY